MAKEPAISTKEIYKSYHSGNTNYLVLKDLSIDFFTSETALILGANGCGKSTFLKLLAGLFRAEKGQVKANAKSLGYLGHSTQLYSSLTVKENLLFFAKLHQLNLKIDQILSAWNLDTAQDKLLSTLSKGNKQKVALAACLMHEPQIILLDEPSTALDEGGQQALRLFLKQRQHSCCTIIATHDIQNWLDLADRLVLIADQKIKLDTHQLKKEQPSLSLQALKNKAIELYRSCNR